MHGHQLLAEAALLDARQVEQVADERDEAVGFLLGAGEDLLVGGGFGASDAEHHRELLVDGRQGGAQLMGDLGHELGLEAVDDLHGRDVVDGHHRPEALHAVAEHRTSPGQEDRYPRTD